MKKVYCTILLCFFFSYFFTFSNAKKQISKKVNDRKMNVNSNSLEIFFKSFDLKSEGEYKDILVSQKHKDNRVSPELIRDFVVTFRPVRLSFSAGVRYKDNKISFWWFFSEFAGEGKPDKVVLLINQLLLEHDFSAKEPKLNEHGNYEHHFYKQKDDIEHHFWIEGPKQFVGSKKPMCGGTLSYEITFQKAIPQPTVKEILDMYPEIACPELPEDIYNYLRDKKFIYIDYGGTWHHYYDWSVGIPNDEEKYAEKQLQEVTKIITQLGYEFYRDDKNIKTYSKNGSFIYLSIEEENIFSFRIQPYS